MKGSGVDVKGSGVNVSGSVGISVGVVKVGIIVPAPGVMVVTLGTHNLSPAKMTVEEDLQLARCNACTVVRYKVAIWNSVSPGCTT